MALPPHDVPLPSVDIVVPVYNAGAFTERCIASVLRHARGDWRLVIVDDASDEPGLAKRLQTLARENRQIRLLRNEHNLGFVASANRGMRESDASDVLLLNSDTEVFEGFLDGLQKCATADASTGIVSPLSNNATICSIPQWLEANAIPNGFSAATFAGMIRRSSRRLRPEIVTPVGFCMYVRRQVLDRIGVFDEATYGRGFGEENDFGETAKKAGFRIRLCDDVFVYHEGSASFKREAEDLKARNADRLERRHPGYHAAVAQFIERNPLRSIHDAIRFHARRRSGMHNAVLFLLHRPLLGEDRGGVEIHTGDLIRALKLPRAVIAWPTPNALVLLEVIDGAVEHALRYEFPLSQPPDRFAIQRADIEAHVTKWIRFFQISGVVLSHLMYWPLDLPPKLNVPYVVCIHDFYAVCPSWNLFDYGQRRQCDCNGPGAGCLPALFQELREPQPPDLPGLRRAHRDAFIGVLARASAITCVSETARELLRRHLSHDFETVVVSNGRDGATTATRPPPGEHLRAAILGSVACAAKGAEAYVQLIQKSRDLPVDWHFFGITRPNGFEERVRHVCTRGALVFHGAYDRSAVFDLLVSHGIDVVVILSPAPETFSFVLSEALIAGIPAVTTDCGALGHRVRESQAGVVVSDATEASRVLERFCRDRTLVTRLASKAAAYRHKSVAENAAEFQRVMERAGLLSGPTHEPVPADMEELEQHYVDVLRSPTLSAASLPDPTGPTYMRRWWYPYFLTVKWLIPKSIRRWGRSRLIRAEHPCVLRLPLVTRQVEQLTDLRVLRDQGQEALYEATSGEPRIVLRVETVSPQRIRVIRFAIRRITAGPGTARLYWTHSETEGFSRPKSVSVPLSAETGPWREYSISLYGSDLGPLWAAGDRIVKLRFDPLDLPGTVELRPIELCE